MPAYDAPHAEGFFVPGPDGWGISGSGIQSLPGLSEQFTQPPIPGTFTSLPGETAYGTRQDPAGISAATAAAQCSANATLPGSLTVSGGHLSLSGSQQLTIGDGHALDLSGTGDGKVVLCQQSVTLRGDSRLTFTAPATVYLVGTSAPTTVTTPAWSGGRLVSASTTAIGHYVQGERAVVERLENGQAKRGGVELVVPSWVTSRSGVRVLGGTFQGAIWAPYEHIFLSSNRDAGDVVNPTDIVALYMSIYGFSGRERFDVRPAETGDAQPPPPLNILNWTN
jgi:hypothetical protein